jgi:hypothetical protein
MLNVNKLNVDAPIIVPSCSVDVVMLNVIRLNVDAPIVVAPFLMTENDNEST